MNFFKPFVAASAVFGLLMANAFFTRTASGQSPSPLPLPADRVQKILDDTVPTLVAVQPKNDRRVVLVVWDGLRPDSISDEFTPTLAKLAREGVFFTRHHSVYPTSTEVNGTAMVTGCYPGHSGLIANREFRPAIDPLKTVAMEDLAAIRKGDEISGGKYLRVPTLPELLQGAGMRTIVTGTKRIVVLMDRAARQPLPDDKYNAQSVVLYEGHTLPEDFQERIGYPGTPPFPTEIHFPNVEQDAWTTNALTHWLWPLLLDGLPNFSVLWMSDPDYTQHQFGPDSTQAHRALASVDANLAALLKGLEAENLRDSTDVLVVSDHGFSSIERGVDTPKMLNDAGFNAVREYKTRPKPGDILVNGLGGSVFLHVAEHDADTIRRVVAFLQGSDFAGVIFTRDGLPGTFPMNAVHIDSPDAPDIVVAMRWTDDKSATGFPGMVVSDGGRKPGQGTHATLSRYDLHNTLIAVGPDFRKGWRDELPSGNVDIAPTIAQLLGLPNPPKMDGRVLWESFSRPKDLNSLPPATERMEAAHDFVKRHWQQYLQLTRYEGVDYLDEGNGSGQFVPEG